MTRRSLVDDAGTTLVELLVTVLLVGIVSVMMFGFLVNMTTLTSRTESDVEAEKLGQLVLKEMSRDIRGAATISVDPGSGAGATCPAGGVYASPYTGYGQCLAFTISEPTDGVSDCPRTEVRYGVASQVLRQDKAVYKLVGGACTLTSQTTGRVMMTGVTNTDVLRYYDGQGTNMLTASPARPPRDARSIEVHLRKQYKPNVAPITMRSVLSLRNKR